MTVGSLMRTMMYHRAQIQRNSVNTVDIDGHPSIPTNFTDFGNPIPCRVWRKLKKEREEDVTKNRTVMLEELIMLVEKDADITELDIISQVTDRTPSTLWTGPFRVDAIQIRHNYKEIVLQAVAT